MVAGTLELDEIGEIPHYDLMPLKVRNQRSVCFGHMNVAILASRDAQGNRMLWSHEC